MTEERYPLVQCSIDDCEQTFRQRDIKWTVCKLHANMRTAATQVQATVQAIAPMDSAAERVLASMAFRGLSFPEAITGFPGKVDHQFLGKFVEKANVWSNRLDAARQYVEQNESMLVAPARDLALRDKRKTVTKDAKAIAEEEDILNQLHANRVKRVSFAKTHDVCAFDKDLSVMDVSGQAPKYGERARRRPSGIVAVRIAKKKVQGTIETSKSVAVVEKSRQYVSDGEHKESRALLTTCMSIEGLDAVATIDNGSNISFISPACLRRVNKLRKSLKKEPCILLPSKNSNIIGIDISKKLPRTEWVLLKVKHGNIVKHVEFDVLDVGSDIHLGLNCLPELGLSYAVGQIQCTFPEWTADDLQVGEAPVEDKDAAYFDDDPTSLKEQQWAELQKEWQMPKEYLDKFMNEIRPVLTKLERVHEDGNMFCTHPRSVVRIPMKKGAKAFQRPRKVPEELLVKLHEHYGKQLEQGLVRLWTPEDGNDFNSPVHVVDKKNHWGMKFDKKTHQAIKKKKFRACLDLREVNAGMDIKLQNNAPDVDEILRQCTDFDVVTTLDLEASFQQCRIAVEDQHKTAFMIPGLNGGPPLRLVCVGAPFGLKHIGMEFQAVIELILAKAKGVKKPAYYDDVTIISKKENHAADVKKVLQALLDNNMKLNLEKCHFAVQKFALLGHIISKEGREADPRKVSELLTKYPILHDTPMDATGKIVRSYLGFVEYLRDYVPNFSSVAAPLYRLVNIKGRLGGRWTDDCTIAYRTINKCLLSGDRPVLSNPDPRYPLHVATDASAVGVGAMLYQEIPDVHGQMQRKYIMFSSKILGDSRMAYSATKRELFGVIFALKEFRDFLYGRHFTLHTDHKALTYIFTQAQPNHMIVEWMRVLLDYDFDFEYCKGIENVLPDKLSRVYNDAFRSYLRIKEKEEEVRPKKMKLVRMLMLRYKSMDADFVSDTEEKESAVRTEEKEVAASSA